VLTTYGTLSAELRAAESSGSKGSAGSSSAANTGSSSNRPFAGGKCTVAEALSHGDGSGAKLPGILGVTWRRVSLVHYINTAFAP
jgi:hypothetical protein